MLISAFRLKPSLYSWNSNQDSRFSFQVKALTWNWSVLAFQLSD